MECSEKEILDLVDLFFSSCGDHVLTNIHNAAVHAQTICNITETISSPLLHALESTILHHKEKLKEVNGENESIREKIQAIKQQLSTGDTDKRQESI